jgi:hypothetical protein
MQNRQGPEIEKMGLACSQTGQILKRTNSTGWNGIQKRNGTGRKIRERFGLNFGQKHFV